MLNDKKIPTIPPLFHNNKFISNFKQKNELFNKHFAKQYSLIQNRSTISLVFIPLTNKPLSSLQFTFNDIKSKINKLEPSKAHGYDMISIRMIKLCGDFIYKPLEMIFKSCLSIH